EVTEIRLYQSGAGVAVADEGFGWVSDFPVLGRYELGVGVVVAPGLTVIGEFSYGATSDTILGGFDSRLSVFTGGARVRWAAPIDSFVRPYVTTGVGLLAGLYRVDSPDRELADNAYGLTWDTAAGVEAQSSGRFSVGGY